MNRHSLRRTRPDAAATVAAVEDVEIQTYMMVDDGIIPNNPSLPVVVMEGAIEAGQSGPSVMALLENNGWRRVWQATVFEYQHYHPTAHEVLVCVSGWADLQLGGPAGDIFRVIDGDALVLPAGTGHCLIDARSDFSVCGGYPKGQENREIVRGIKQARGDASAQIAKVGLPASDPVFGEGGPLLDLWA